MGLNTHPQIKVCFESESIYDCLRDETPSCKFPALLQYVEYDKPLTQGQTKYEKRNIYNFE